MSLVDRKSPTRIQPRNGNLQYECDITRFSVDVSVAATTDLQHT